MVPAPSQVLMSRLSSSSRIPCCRARAGSPAAAREPPPLASQFVIAVHQLHCRAQRPDAIKLGHRRVARCDDGDVEVPATTRPREGLTKVARAGAHHRSTTTVGEKARDKLRAASLKLRTGFAVSSLMLTAHPRTASGPSQRNNGVSRKTGSITSRAARIRPMSSRVSGTSQQPSATDAAPTCEQLARRPVARVHPHAARKVSVISAERSFSRV